MWCTESTQKLNHTDRLVKLAVSYDSNKKKLHPTWERDNGGVAYLLELTAQLLQKQDSKHRQQQGQLRSPHSPGAQQQGTGTYTGKRGWRTDHRRHLTIRPSGKTCHPLSKTLLGQNRHRVPRQLDKVHQDGWGVRSDQKLITRKRSMRNHVKEKQHNVTDPPTMVACSVPLMRVRCCEDTQFAAFEDGKIMLPIVCTGGKDYPHAIKIENPTKSKRVAHSGSTLGSRCSCRGYHQEPACGR